jgi:hypothetical protein
MKEILTGTKFQGIFSTYQNKDILKLQNNVDNIGTTI